MRSDFARGHDCGSARGTRFSAIAPNAGMDDQDVVFDPEDQAICVVNANAPPARTVAFERFGLTETGVSVAVNALEQEMQTAQGLAVAGLPFLELLPSDVRPELLHAGTFSSSWEFPHHFWEAAATRGNDNSSARLRSPMASITNRRKTSPTPE